MRGGDHLHAELLWYYSDSAAEMGDCSSYGSMVTALQCGQDDMGYPSDPTTLGMLIAAGRQRRIRAALALLKPGRESALRAFYTPERRHSSKHFGDYAPVVTMLQSAHKAYYGAMAKDVRTNGKRTVPDTLDEWLGGLCRCASFKDPDTGRVHVSKCNSVLLLSLHNEASGAVKQARIEFDQAWKDTAPVRRSHASFNA